MMNHDGSAPVDDKMPSNRLAEAFISGGLFDKPLNRAETIVNLCGFLPHGLLGSSASNHYRTAFLQKHPFPTDFGHCGDTAWESLSLLSLRWLSPLVPVPGSTAKRTLVQKIPRNSMRGTVNLQSLQAQFSKATHGLIPRLPSCLVGLIARITP